MAEELISCWNSPRNLFSSSPCSLGYWPSYEMIMDVRSYVGSSDDSASDGSSAVLGAAQSHINSDLQIMGISSATAGDWNQDLRRDTGKSEENYSNFLLDSSTLSLINSSQDSGADQQQPLNSISTSPECVTTSSYSYASSLLQTLFDTDSQAPTQSLLEMNTNCATNSNGFLPSASPMPRQQPTAHRNIWNSTAAALTDAPCTFLPASPQSHFISSSLTNHNKPLTHTTAAKQPREQGKDFTTVVKKASNEPAFKRPRIETPSPLPTFKVRKEKLGDRITALQQLVSPFGKTDTASVLHEAIEYIKFLHDQVNALSTPYLKYGSPPAQRQQEDRAKDEEGLTKELKTRGLCLVPVSSTFPVAAETTTDFWTPTFGGSFR